MKEKMKDKIITHSNRKNDYRSNSHSMPIISNTTSRHNKIKDIKVDDDVKYTFDNDKNDQHDHAFDNGHDDGSIGDDDEEEEEEDDGEDNEDDDEDFTDNDDDGRGEPVSNRNITTKCASSDHDQDLPLYERLLARNRPTSIEPPSIARSADDTKTRRLRKLKEETDEEKRKLGRSNKNHPAEMPSNRPVKRLRIDANNKTNKFRDPRFSDISGVLDDKIFAKNYSFLDEYREKEIDVVAKSMKKIKNPDKKAELKAELMKMKQQHAERRRGLAVMSKLEDLKRQEKEKVKSGKKPFFLKNSVKKSVALEERYNELKKEGKLHKYMEKRRRKNAAKDRRYLPE